jgi:hypothetical protein
LPDDEQAKKSAALVHQAKSEEVRCGARAISGPG